MNGEERHRKWIDENVFKNPDFTIQNEKAAEFGAKIRQAVLVQYTEWVFGEIANFNACFTGDCNHDSGEECTEHLIEVYTELKNEEAKMATELLRKATEKKRS